MANIQQYDNQTQLTAVKKNNELTAVMSNSTSWAQFMQKLPVALQKQIPNDVFAYVTKHIDTVQEMDGNEFMARVIECYSQGYTLVDGDAYILPYWNNKEKRKVATFIKGYLGIKRRADESGLFRYFTVSRIYKGAIKGYNHRRGVPIFNDEFIPNGTEEVIGYLGYYQLAASGAEHEIYSTPEQLEKHAIKYSPQSRKAEHLAGTWSEAFDAMCQKTMYLKLGKLAPKIKNPTQQQAQFYASLENDDEPQYDRPQNIDADGVVTDYKVVDDGETLPFDEPQTDLFCADCGATIKDNVYQFSSDKFGKPLCFNCQKKYKGN